MSWRGTRWRGAVAESFFIRLKKERIRKRIYKTRALAQADIFDYIEFLQAKPITPSPGGASVLRPLNRSHCEVEKCPPERGGQYDYSPDRAPS